MFHKITDNVYYTEHEEKTDRPAMGYIKGTKYSLMVESGNSKANTEIFLNGLKDLGLREPDFVAITHSHWDHSFGLSYLNAISIACRKTNADLKEMTEWQWSDKMLREYVEINKIPLFCEPHIRLEYPDFSQIKVKPADIEFNGTMTIELGNQPCILKNVISPHTDDCVLVYVPKEKVVFLGDSIYEELVGDEWIPHSDKLASLIDELDKLDFNIAVEGHFAPKTKEELLTTLKEKL